MSPRAVPPGSSAGDQRHGGGAIAAAASWCAGARRAPLPPTVMAFGSDDAAWVLIGEARSLRLDRCGAAPLSAASLWSQVEQFCAPGGFVAGYIGFDTVWPDGTRRHSPGPDAPPTLHLWEPGGVLRVDAQPGRKPTAAPIQPYTGLDALQPQPVAAGQLLSLGDCDAGLEDYGESVRQALAAIRCGELARLTLQRRVELPADLDLLAGFAAPPGRDNLGIGRSFYLHTAGLELAGHSPELLGVGDRRRFTCYKLSGTGPRSDDPVEDQRLRARLLAGAKIQNEHALSIEAAREALGRAGEVVAGPMDVLDRDCLRHLVTPLAVAVRPGTAWSTILQALLPSGAQPRLPGLAALDRLEPGSRGPYYGIIGLRTPEGRFEFSQVLRTLFRDRSGVYTRVGAAITAGSTVEGECEETRLKLADMVAVMPGRGVAPVSPSGAPGSR